MLFSVISATVSKWVLNIALQNYTQWLSNLIVHRYEYKMGPSSGFIPNVNINRALALHFSFSGVWWQRFVPVIHQHISRPAVRPAGTGSHLWRTCCGCRFWQPLLQNLPLPAVVALLPQHTNCTECTYSHIHSLVWSNQQICTHPLTHSPIPPRIMLSLCHLFDCSSHVCLWHHWVKNRVVVWIKCEDLWYSQQLPLICFLRSHL